MHALPHIVNNKKEILFQFYLSSRNTYVTSPQTSLVTVVTSIVLSYFRDWRWNQSYPQISNEGDICRWFALGCLPFSSWEGPLLFYGLNQLDRLNPQPLLCLRSPLGYWNSSLAWWQSWPVISYTGIAPLDRGQFRFND